jgi:hypothetical protein
MEKTIEDPYKDTRVTYYTAMLLKYDEDDFEYLFEKSLEDIQKKTNIHIEVLNASLSLSKKIHSETVEWAICDKNYCSIIIGSQDYDNINFEYAKKQFFKFIYKVNN